MLVGKAASWWELRSFPKLGLLLVAWILTPIAAAVLVMAFGWGYRGPIAIASAAAVEAAVR